MKKELFQLVQFLQRTGNRDAPNLEGLCYPEWDYREGKLVEEVCSVSVESPNSQPNDFYEKTLQKYQRQIGKIAERSRVQNI